MHLRRNRMGTSGSDTARACRNGLHVVIVQGTRQHPHDGWGPKHTIDEVLGALTAAGIEASTIVVGGASDLENIQWGDCVAFPNARRFYDPAGQTYSLSRLLEERGIPLVGSGPEGHAAENKPYMKRILAAHGVLTPAWALVATSSSYAAKGLRFPVIVKPEAGSNSVGVQRVEDTTALDAALKYVRDEFGPCQVLVEEWVREREFTVAVIGNGRDRQGFPIEIALPTDRSFLSAEVKHRLLVEAVPVTDEAMSKRLAELGVAVCSALKVQDWARVDVLGDSASDLYVVDVNTMPGLHRQKEHMSGFPSCLKYGRSMTYDESVLAIVGNALLRHDLPIPWPIEAVIAKLLGT